MRDKRHERLTARQYSDQAVILIFYTRLYKGKQAGVARGEGGKSLYSGNNLRGISQEQFLRIVSQNLREELAIAVGTWHDKLIMRR